MRRPSHSSAQLLPSPLPPSTIRPTMSVQIRRSGATRRPAAIKVVVSLKASRHILLCWLAWREEGHLQWRLLQSTRMSEHRHWREVEAFEGCNQADQKMQTKLWMRVWWTVASTWSLEGRSFRRRPLASSLCPADSGVSVSFLHPGWK